MNFPQSNSISTHACRLHEILDLEKSFKLLNVITSIEAYQAANSPSLHSEQYKESLAQAQRILNALVQKIQLRVLALDEPKHTSPLLTACYEKQYSPADLHNADNLIKEISEFVDKLPQSLEDTDEDDKQDHFNETKKP